MKQQFSGLSQAEVQRAREVYGSNELAAPQRESFWHKFVQNFKSPIILILCVALGIVLLLSFFELSEWYETVAIAFAVLLATLVSTLSEYRNESSFQKLQSEATAIESRVYREAQLLEIPISEIVVGDLVMLQAGDQIPADGQIFQGEIKVNQASLNGEAELVTKTTAEVKNTNQAEERDFLNPHLVFRGTTVEEGEAIMQVEAVGRQTFYGQLARELAVSDDRPSPLQVKLKGLARLISQFGYWGASLIAIFFMFNKIIVANAYDPEKIAQYLSQAELVFKDVLDACVLAIIIMVAAVPEGLPMMIAIVLSLNMRKMLEAKVLVRKLLGIETAGSLNLLFSDKTGTITRGELKAELFLTGEQTSYDQYISIPSPLKDLLRVAILENSFAGLSAEGEAIGGNTSERALMGWVSREERLAQAASETKTISTIPFNSSQKFSASTVQGGKVFTQLFGQAQMSFVKGATEIVLQRCTHYYDHEGKSHPFHDLTVILEKADDLADTGIRLIAIAVSAQDLSGLPGLPDELTLVGILGIRDGIRAESKEAIRRMHKAGIQIVMITGDRKGTALAIAREVDLIRPEEEMVVLTSKELNQHSDEEIEALLPRLRVVARALPTDKSRLVRIAKKLGKVVGMTGDGVNDAAALKQADVGFAMGSGSEVAKEAGDIVIMDDNFASLGQAVVYGRTIFKSIRKFIIFQLTVNLAAVLTVFLGPFLGVDFPLTIIQILWINIIMDTLAAIAFGGEPALLAYMEEPPVARKASILNLNMISAILVGGIYTSAFSLFFLKLDWGDAFFYREGVYNWAVHLSAFFNLFIFLIIFNAFNARTENYHLGAHLHLNRGFIYILTMIITLQIIFTYLGGDILRTVPLTASEWGLVLALASTILPVDLLRKFLFRQFLARQQDVFYKN